MGFGCVDNSIQKPGRGKETPPKEECCKNMFGEKISQVRGDRQKNVQIFEDISSYHPGAVEYLQPVQHIEQHLMMSHRLQVEKISTMHVNNAYTNCYKMLNTLTVM